LPAFAGNPGVLRVSFGEFCEIGPAARIFRRIRTVKSHGAVVRWIRAMASLDKVV
jgi:hypothetical protein